LAVPFPEDSEQSEVICLPFGAILVSNSGDAEVGRAKGHQLGDALCFGTSGSHS
jgi:hypothetical protein